MLDARTGLDDFMECKIFQLTTTLMNGAVVTQLARC
jgi:hypothetical protein